MRQTTWILAGLVLAGLADLHPAAAQEKKTRYPKPPSAENVAVVPEAWKTTPRKPLTPGEIDQLLAEAHAKGQPTPAALVNDEQFIRRVSLDLTGKLPLPAEIDAFVRATEADKKSKLIERLLASEDFARFWARYWRDVLLWRATDQRIVIRLPRTVALE